MLAAKRLLHKAVHHSQHHVQHSILTSADLNLRVTVHYGIPSTASILAFDPVQRLLAIGTLDGRIKVIGGDGIEGLLISPKQLPYKNLEFLRNEGYLVSISNDNDIQVWNLESRCLACCLEWESNITAFSVVSGSHFMYVGDEYGLISVIKYDAEDEKLVQLPYHISANSTSEAAGLQYLNDQPVIEVLQQPGSSGNRILIAYANGFVTLRDVSEGQVLFVGSSADLQLKDEVLESSGRLDANLTNDAFGNHLGEKEISALCWASSNGSILAVGYTDGDILFWKTSFTDSSKNPPASPSSKSVVKLQLSSSERRLPVIVLNWCASHKALNNCDGQLFIYGGDEIGSEEVLTVLQIEWSSGMDILRCVGRVDITLNGSFADIILLPHHGASGDDAKSDLFILMNPGQLHFYDHASLSVIMSKSEKKPSVAALEFPSMIPVANPSMTVSKLSKLPTGVDLSKVLPELSTPLPATGANWPLTGGVPVKKENVVQRMYVAGYIDGSIRIWDATYPVFSFICVIEGEVEGIKIAGSSAPVSNFDICFTSCSLVVGNECGLVRVYKLKASSDEINFDFVTETKREVHNLPKGSGPQCRAVFSLLNSPVQALKFSTGGAKLGVGFGCGRIAILDMHSFSVLSFIEGVTNSSSPVISMIWKELSNANSPVKSSKGSETKLSINIAEEVLFILTKNAKINVIDGSTGNMISSKLWHLKKESVAVSMYVIDVSMPSSGSSDEKHAQDAAARNDSRPDSRPIGITSQESKHHSSSETSSSGERFLDSLILLCCEDSLRLYSTKGVIQGNNKPIRKVRQSKCCWTTTFEKNGQVCGLIILFQTGVIEIRSLPSLELMTESSLLSILRWSFKANMDKMMSSSENGQIVLVNGCELAFLSLLAAENDFRIPEFLPCLHDKVLAAAADAAFSFSLNQKKKQNTAPGILGGIVKGFKGAKMTDNVDLTLSPKSNNAHLERIFLNPPFADSSSAVTKNQEAVELDIDDIEIDEVPALASTSSNDIRSSTGAEKNTDREKLFDGGTEDWKPRIRTQEEIMATYRKTGDASSVAAHARNKLMERQEKLERISRRTEDLRNNAEDFASLANELVKTMERRKWWQI